MKILTVLSSVVDDITCSSEKTMSLQLLIKYKRHCAVKLVILFTPVKEFCDKKNFLLKDSFELQQVCV